MMERNIETGKNIVKENERKDTAIYIPDDVKSQCFQKLPLKSAFQMRLLSKHWDETIASPQFFKAFLSESIAKPRILFTSKFGTERWFHSILQEKPPELLSPKEVFLPRGMGVSFNYVTQMVLGLVVCYDAEGDWVIHNPSIGKFKTLPKVVRSKGDEDFYFLGFDRRSQEFKVLCVVTGSSRIKYQVISLHENSWRNVDCEISHFPTSEGFWFDGKIYYTAYSNTKEDDFFIMCFNLENEEFSIIIIPEEAKTRIRYQNWFLKINDKLALVNKDIFDIPGEAKIWILEEATTWSRHPFDISSLLTNKYRCIGTIGTDQFIFVPDNHSNRELHIIYYDFGKRHREDIIIEGFDTSCIYRTDVFLDYIENPTLNSSENI